MFWKTGTGSRCLVISYAAHGERSIRVRYAYQLKMEDLDEIDFVDSDYRDLYLDGLDSGAVRVIDRKTARGAIA